MRAPDEKQRSNKVHPKGKRRERVWVNWVSFLLLSRPVSGTIFLLRSFNSSTAPSTYFRYARLVFDGLIGVDLF